MASKKIVPKKSGSATSGGSAKSESDDTQDPRTRPSKEPLQTTPSSNESVEAPPPDPVDEPRPQVEAEPDPPASDESPVEGNPSTGTVETAHESLSRGSKISASPMPSNPEPSVTTYSAEPTPSASTEGNVAAPPTDPTPEDTHKHEFHSAKSSLQAPPSDTFTDDANPPEATMSSVSGNNEGVSSTSSADPVEEARPSEVDPALSATNQRDSTTPKRPSSRSNSSESPPTTNKIRPPKPGELLLYHNEQSYFSQIARMALYLRAIPFTPIEIDIARGEQYTPEFLRLNPRGEVPVLHDGRTNFILNECFDILRYLNNEYPEAKGPLLFPKRHFASERVERLCMRLLKLKLDWLTFGSIVFEDVPCDPHGIFADPDVRAKIKQFLKHRKPILEAQLRKHSDDVDHQLGMKIRNLDKDWHYIENKEDYLKLVDQFQAVFEEIVANLKVIQEEVQLAKHSKKSNASATGNEETWLSPEGPSAADCVLAVMLHRIQLLGFGRKLIVPVEPLKLYFHGARGLEAFRRAVGDEYGHSASSPNCTTAGAKEEAEEVPMAAGPSEMEDPNADDSGRYEEHHKMVIQMVQLSAGYNGKGPTGEALKARPTMVDRIEAPALAKKDCKGAIAEAMARTTQRKSGEESGVVRLWREGWGNRRVLPQRSSILEPAPPATGGAPRKSSMRPSAQPQEQQQRLSAGADQHPKQQQQQREFPILAAMLPAGTIFLFALIGLLQGPAPRRVLIGPQTLLAAEIASFWQSALQ